MTETVHSPSIKGNISDAVHPAKLLTGFLKAKKSGVLRFRDGITVADVALAHGSVVYDRALAVRSRGFGNYLTDKDKIRPRQLRRLIALAGSQDRTLPEQLVADGVITPDELDAVLEQYYWDAADGVFGWRRGTYAFEEKDLAEDAGAAARDATLAFIVRGVAEHYDPLAIARRLQKRMHHALRVNADNDPPADALRGLPEAAAMLDAAAGGATLKEATGVSADDKALGMATAFALLTLGVLKFAVPEDKRREVAEVRRVRTSRDPLQKLFAAAMTSVDRIHERVARETREEIEVPIAPAGAEPRTTEQIENAERELQEKLDRLLELKRQRRTIIEEHAHGESAGPATETMEEAPPDAPTIMDDGFAATLSHDTPEQDAAFDGGEDEDHRSFSFRNRIRRRSPAGRQLRRGQPGRLQRRRPRRLPTSRRRAAELQPEHEQRGRHFHDENVARGERLANGGSGLQRAAVTRLPRRGRRRAGGLGTLPPGPGGPLRRGRRTRPTGDREKSEIGHSLPHHGTHLPRRRRQGHGGTLPRPRHRDERRLLRGQGID
ncbi:MAG: hypothetical protein M5R36_18760 [Deltaproteobacteria bacterium]|nr:hypothetical protein [Deltaproteobacteria bacterium]